MQREAWQRCSHGGRGTRSVNSKSVYELSIPIAPAFALALVATEILVFDAAGQHIDTWGGSGDGPGEFRYLEWLAFLPPDSLAAGDGGLRRWRVPYARRSRL